MKLLDYYILKNFIQNFLFGMFSFIIIFILVDVFENLDKFVDANLSIFKVAEYYFYFIPEIIKLITPIGMLLASLFTVSRFINFSELTAMQSAGMGIYRYMLPILIFAAFVTGFSTYFDGYIVPESNKKKFEFERTLLGKNVIMQSYSNLFYQEDKNIIIGIQQYLTLNKSANNITINIFNADDLNVLIDRYDIETMNWNQALNSWDMYNIHIRHFPADSTSHYSYEFIPFANISRLSEISHLKLTPDLIRKRQLKPDEMGLSEHRQFIDNLRSTGLETSRAEVDYYSRISFPFASIVTVLFGVSLSNNRRKGGAAMQFGISILISFIYLGFVKISKVFGYNGDLNPLLTAWLANFIFLSISVINFYRIQKFS